MKTQGSAVSVEITFADLIKRTELQATKAFVAAYNALGRAKRSAAAPSEKNLARQQQRIHSISREVEWIFAQLNIGIRKILVEHANLVAAVDSRNDQIAHISEELEVAKTTDQKTGLYHGESFKDSLTAYFENFEGTPGQTTFASLWVMDIRNFHGVNRTFGLLGGDFIIQNVGACVKKHIRAEREGDIHARFGGDEFAVLMRGLPSPELIESGKITSRFAEAIQEIPGIVNIQLPADRQLARNSLFVDVGVVYWEEVPLWESVRNDPQKVRSVAQKVFYCANDLADRAKVEAKAGRGTGTLVARGVIDPSGGFHLAFKEAS